MFTLNNRVATHLENLENGKVGEFKSGQGKVRGKGKVRKTLVKVCSCIWSITTSIGLDRKCAKRELFTR